MYDDARVRAAKPPPAEMPSGMMGAALARSMASENKVRGPARPAFLGAQSDASCEQAPRKQKATTATGKAKSVLRMLVGKPGGDGETYTPLGDGDSFMNMSGR